jgi:hypothetical protein
MHGHHESCRQQGAILDTAPTKFLGAVVDASLVDPRSFGLVKAAYGVGETLELLSIGELPSTRLLSAASSRRSNWQEDVVLPQRPRHISDAAKGGVIKTEGRIVAQKKRMSCAMGLGDESNCMSDGTINAGRIEMSSTDPALSEVMGTYLRKQPAGIDGHHVDGEAPG